MRKGPSAVVVVIGLLLGGWLLAPVAAQGPFTAQVQRALNAFLGAAHTWTGAQTAPSFTATGAVTGNTVVATTTVVAGTTVTAGTNLVSTSGNVLATAGNAAIAATGSYQFNGRARVYSIADGLFKFIQNSNTVVGVEVNSGTAVPTVANCSVGSTGAILVHSTNTAGSVTPGSGSTACDVVFGTPAYSFAPFCVITDNTSVILAPKISARSTTGFTVTGLTAGDTFTYVCLGGSI